MSDVARAPARRASATRPSPGRCCSARRSSCATWPRWAATCASARAARTCATASRRATSASPGSGCAALDGFNRGHAILGTSEHCIATHPSDVAVALVAFDAVVQTVGPRRRARDPDRRLLPAAGRHARASSTRSSHGELIVGIDVPGAPIARRSTYLKFRDRQSYEFALVSVAAALDVRGRRRRGRAARARRRRHEALAGAAGGGRARRRSGRARRRSGAPRAPSSRTPSSASTTRSRSSSPSGRSCGARAQRER